MTIRFPERFYAELVIRALTGGAAPTLGDTVVFTSEGWKFREGAGGGGDVIQEFSTINYELEILEADEERERFVVRVFFTEEDHEDFNFEIRWKVIEFDFTEPEEEEPPEEPEEWESPPWGVWEDFDYIEPEEEPEEEESPLHIFEKENEVERGSTPGAQEWPVIIFFQIRNKDEVDYPERWTFGSHYIAPTPREIVISEDEVDLLWAPRRIGSLWLQEEEEPPEEPEEE